MYGLGDDIYYLEDKLRKHRRIIELLGWQDIANDILASDISIEEKKDLLNLLSECGKKE